MNQIQQNEVIKSEPLSQLVLSKLNVRKSDNNKEIAELAANILDNGLLQNLTAIEAKGGKKFEIIAGGRRLQALQLLAKNKQIATGFDVPVMIVGSVNATDISLSENAMRIDLHPSDQFDAFQKLIDDGKSIEDVAAKFNVTPAVVKRRLKMAGAAPEVIEAFRDGKVTLDQVMGLCSSDDHRVQVEILEKAINDDYFNGEIIRSEIFDHTNGIDVRNRIVKFVTLEDYRSHGGRVQEDLFATAFDGEEGDCTLIDPIILNNLADEKLAMLTSAAMQKNKLSWHKPMFDCSYMPSSDYCEIKKPTAEQKKRLGVIGYIDHSGNPQIKKNVCKRSDLKGIEKLETNPDAPFDSSAEKSTKPDLPAAAVQALTASCSSALQIEIANRPSHALRILALRLMQEHSYQMGSVHVSASIHDESLIQYNPELEFNHGYLGMQALHEEFGISEILESDDPIVQMAVISDEDILRLLAYLTARTFNCVTTFADNVTDDFQTLGKYFNLNMTQYWKATAENYFGKLNKQALIQLIKAKDDLTKTDKMKRDELATLAESLYEGSGFIPEFMCIEK